VSQNKSRIKVGNFDLDLAYIEPKIIAMSLPCTGMETIYRNPIDEVAHFLDLKHGTNYQVYNLCSEKDYPTHFFHDRVTRIPFDDHGPPTLQQLLDFTNVASSYLRRSEDSVVVVHCKGGKGRTGTMIAALLLRRGICKTPEKALFYFARKRTSNDEDEIKPPKIQPDDSVDKIIENNSEEKYDDTTSIEKNKKKNKKKSLVRVSGPSQIRYVHYFFSLLDSARKNNADLVSVHDDAMSPGTSRKQSLRLMTNEDDVKLQFTKIKRKLLRVQFDPAPKLSSSCTLRVNTFQKSLKHPPMMDSVIIDSKDSSSGIFEFDSIVCDDVKFTLMYTQFQDFSFAMDMLEVVSGGLTKNVAEKELCFFHLHMSMLKEKEDKNGVTIVELKKNEVDGAVKDKKCSVFASNTRVLIYFGQCSNDGGDDECKESKKDDDDDEISKTRSHSGDIAIDILN